jgi:carbonic anhydrase/acetyltransferase-like protein (isoleucine patch superfamily)
VILEFGADRPTLGTDVYVAPTATIIGRVVIGRASSVWFGSIVRGDSELIAIGEETNIQDLTMVHGDTGIPVAIGNRVTIGHRAVVHGCTIEDECLVGMGSIIQNRATIGNHSIIASGSVVREGFRVPPGTLVAGVPATVKRELTPEEIAYITKPAEIYLALARRYRALEQVGARRRPPTRAR